jgi:hypothetical protein
MPHVALVKAVPLHLRGLAHLDAVEDGRTIVLVFSALLDVAVYEEADPVDILAI